MQDYNSNIVNNNLVFIDSNIDNYQTLISGIDNADVILLDSSSNGVEQITEQLANYSQLDSIQIISHGDDGSLQLGNILLDHNSLDVYAEDLQQWGKALNAHGDLLFYGCNLAASSDGLALVGEISQLTGADVAASSDLTGHSGLGGDWDLEVATGKIETEVAIDQGTQESFSGQLNLLVNGSFEANAVNGNRWANFAPRNVAGWQSLNGERIEIWDSGFKGVASTDGTNHLELDFRGGNAAIDGIYQNIQTIADQTYTLSFDMRSHGVNFNSNDESVLVEWNGTTLENTGYRATAAREWTTITVEVTGTGGSDRLLFRESVSSGASDGSGPFLDNISLQANSGANNGQEFSLSSSTITVDEGASSLDLTVNRSGNISNPASVSYSTEAQTAIALQDFIAVEGTLTFGAGQESMTIRIPIIDDTNVEEDETFAIQLSNPSNNATLGTQRTVVAINDNDRVASAGTLTFTGPMTGVSEDVGTARVRVARVGGSEGSVRVNYTTDNDYAQAGLDYIRTTGSLTFATGVTEQFIEVPILDDNNAEGTETFFLTLTDPVGGAAIGTESIMVAIADNDTTPTSPVDDGEYRYIRFVANTEVNNNPWTSVAELNLLDNNNQRISQANWTLESVNSEETAVGNLLATNAFDGNPNTIWHTEYFSQPGRSNDPSHPHELVIDLGATYDIDGFSYLPRQDRSTNGQVANYALFGSDDGQNWGTALSTGTLQNIKSEQIINFEDTSPPGLTLGLVGHWQLNETLANQTVRDSSGVGSNGTAQNIQGLNGPYNAAPIFDTPNPRSWDFDGVDDYISIASDPDLDLSGGSFTQSVWINSDSTDNGYHGILGNQNGAGAANRYAGIWVYQQNRIHAGFGDGTNWNNFTTGAVLKPDAWNHVVTSFDGTTYKAFVNGEEVFASNEFAGRAPIALDSFDIGRVNNYFEGQIDDVRIYNRGLSDQEIQSLYQVQPDAAQVGSWSDVIEFPNIPVAAAALPNGKIVTWSSWDRFRFAGNRFDRTYTSLFDTNTREVGEFLETDTNHDMFCPGTVMLPDGRLLVNGGGGDTKFSSVYDFTTNTWSTVDSMEYGRWYNVSVTLGDGSVFTLGGNRSNGRQGPGELWTEDTGWQTLSGATINPISSAGQRGDEHPQLFAAPNGKVFVAGPSSTMYWYDVSGEGSYTEAGLRGDDTYSQNGLTVMYDEGKLLRAGGQSLYNGGVVTDVVYDIDINNENNVTVDKQDPMNYKRSFATGVVMADGQVFVVGGSERGVTFRDDEAVYRPEIWNPDTGEWTLGDQQAVARTYHSVALLQPDGRIFVGGGGLCGNCNTNHPDAEIYTPAYLYNDDGTLADRPVIGAGPDQAGYNQDINISVDNDMPITEFNLVRLSSVTHSVNTDQRFLSVDFTANGNNSYTLTTPENGNIAPPGYYMLFAFNDQGVPSEAKMIQISSSIP